MKRRAFITLLGVAALGQPLAARAQRPLPVVGMLNSGAVRPRRDQLDGFLAGLKEMGYVPGDNVNIRYLGAEDHYERLPGLAAEFVRERVAVIATVGGPVAALAAKHATTTIPIVFAAVSDPVRSGLVASLNRPGGNATGSAGLAAELDAKRLELLGELTSARTVATLINPRRPGVEGQEHDLRTAAQSAGRELIFFRTGDPAAIDAAFATMTERKIGSLLVGADPFFNNHRQQIILLATRHAIVAVYQWREFAVEGGLVSYGASLPEAYRLSGVYAGRILRGEKPENLPVVQPAKFELVINLKAAKAIGLAVPPTLLARADEVIE